ILEHDGTQGLGPAVPFAGADRDEHGVAIERRTPRADHGHEALLRTRPIEEARPTARRGHLLDARRILEARHAGLEHEVGHALARARSATGRNQSARERKSCQHCGCRGAHAFLRPGAHRTAAITELRYRVLSSLKTVWFRSRALTLRHR